MSKWQKIKLGEILSLTSGKSKTKKNLHQFSKQYQVPVYGGNGINGYTDEGLINEHVIVIGRVGEYCGSVYLTENVSWVTDNALYTKSVTTGTNLRYLYYLLKYNNLGRLRSQSGQPLISQKPIYELEVDFAPEEDQQKIASILSSVDEAIEKTAAIIQQTEKAKKGLMQQLLTKGIGHTKFKKTEIGEIPEEWEVHELGEVTSITRLAGAEYSDLWETRANGEIISLRGFNIGNNELVRLEEVERISESLSERLIRSKLFEGDVVFPCVGTIGKAAVIREDNKYHINQNIAKITGHDKLEPDYIAYFLMSDITLKQIIKYNTSSSQPNVLVGNLRKFVISIPSLEEQRRIVDIFINVDKKIKNEQQKHEQLKQVKAGLMQSLLTGKVRVKVDESKVTQV